MKPIVFLIALILCLFGLTSQAQCPQVKNLSVSAGYASTGSTATIMQQPLPITWSVWVNATSTVAPVCIISVNTGVLLPGTLTTYLTASINATSAGTITDDGTTYRRYNYTYTLPAMPRPTTSKQKITVTPNVAGCSSGLIQNVNTPNGGIATVIVNGAYRVGINCDPTALPLDNPMAVITYIDNAVASMRIASPNASPVILKFLDNDNFQNNRQFNFQTWADYEADALNQASPLRVFLNLPWKTFPFDVTNQTFIHYNGASTAVQNR